MKSSVENFIEKMLALCECPIIFISYPISEEAASPFVLSKDNLEIKNSIFKLVPELSVLEVKLVPGCMSQNKFNLILFLVTSDYPYLDGKVQDETISTNDTLTVDKIVLEPSDFLRNQMEEMGISQEFSLELSENLADAFAKCEFDDNDWIN